MELVYLYLDDTDIYRIVIENTIYINLNYIPR